MYSTRDRKRLVATRLAAEPGVTTAILARRLAHLREVFGDPEA